MRYWPVALVLLLLAVPTPAAGGAGATSGEIRGVVRDETGGTLAAVRLMARDPASGFERRGATGPDGRYRLESLPVGRYDVTAELGGFRSRTVAALEVHVGETLTVPLTLTLEAFTASATATAAPPMIDLARTQPATVVGERAIDRLPTAGRRFHDFVLLTPGVVQVQQDFAGGGLAVAGQRGIDTAWNVDGVDYGNPFFGGIRGGERSHLAYTVSQEAIEEFQVSNAGYDAEYGRSGGGLVNVVTKRGANQVVGSLFWYFRDEHLTADDPFGRPPTDFSQHQFGGSLGGPLRRDRLHYFAAYDQQRHRSPFVVEFQRDPTGIVGFEGKDGTFTSTNDVWSGFLRLDQQANDRHRLTLRLSASRNEAENGFGSSPVNLSTEQSALERDEITTTVLEWSSIVSPRRSQTTRAQWTREDRPRQPNTLDPTVFVEGLGGIGRAAFLPALETDERYQATHSGTWLRGRHTVRAGADLDFTHTEQPFFLLLSGGFYYFANLDDYLATVATGEQRWTVYLQGFGRAAVDFWQREYAAFVQDDWAISERLNLSAGLRWDAQINPRPDDPNPDLPGSDEIPSDREMWAPRLGLTWDPLGDARSVVRFNAGLFYSRTPALLFVSPITTNGRGQLQLAFFPFLPVAPTYPEVLPSAPTGAFALPSDVYIVARDFRNPRTLRTSVEYERELRPGLTLGASYTYGRLERLERLRDLNVFPAAGTAPDGRLLYSFERPDPRFARILQIESTASGRHDGVTLSLRRRSPTGRVNLQAFYTWSRARDDDSNERDHLNIYYMDWQHLDREVGPSRNDVRHNFVASGDWRLPWGLEVGWIATAHSGSPYGHLSANDLNFDGSFGNDREFRDGRDTGRNAFRQPGYRRLDLRLSKAVRLGGERALDLALDLFNATDADNTWVPIQNQFFDAGPGGRNPRLDRRDAQLGEPRSAQLSVRLRF